MNNDENKLDTLDKAAIATTVTSTAVLATGATASVLGFSTGGIVAGSAAAGIQAGIGNVVAGSVFATMTSLGATGVFAGLSLVGGIGLSVVGLGYGAVKLIKHFK